MKQIKQIPLFCVVFNVFVVMVLFTVCRIIFIAYNHSLFPNITTEKLSLMLSGGLMFDISAILYSNILYIVAALIPFRFRVNKNYQTALKILFIVTNTITIIANLADTVFFENTQRRTTFSVFNEFQNESLGGVFWIEIVDNWYLVLAAVLFFITLIALYQRQLPSSKSPSPIAYYTFHTLIFLAVIYPIVGGMRGGFDHATRPITISNANKYIEKPIEAGIVLNTPFAIFRTLGDDSFPAVQYFSAEQTEEMTALFSPIHIPSDSTTMRPLNVVVIIMESFGREYSGYLNSDKPNYKGYMHFLDSLMQQGLTFQYSFANGRKSIDALPSILSSIPQVIEPFFLTKYSMNELSGIAGELGKKGYHTSFFHGAKNGSMGLEAFTNVTGFDHYYGRTEFNNDALFDGYWGIWDEPFLQFYAQQLSTFPQPFVSSVFTLSSHHPFQVPTEYEGIFSEGTQPIHKCVTYSDNALRKFFDTVKKESWFDNTLFVITADHTNQTDSDEFLNENGLFAVPIIFYHSGDTVLQGYSEKIAQQIDIMPTILGYVGYDEPFVAFGQNLLATDTDKKVAFNYINGIYQLHQNDYLLQFDGNKTIALYNFKADPLLENNLIENVDMGEDVTFSKQIEEMEQTIRSIIQQYMERMINNRLIVATP